LNYDITPKEGEGQLAPEEYELRRRIVWAAFSGSYWSTCFAPIDDVLMI
jgi:hypothetical protein